MDRETAKKIRVKDPLTGQILELSPAEISDMQESGIYISEESIVKDADDS